MEGSLDDSHALRPGNLPFDGDARFPPFRDVPDRGDGIRVHDLSLDRALGFPGDSVTTETRLPRETEPVEGLHCSSSFPTSGPVETYIVHPVM